MDDPFLAISVVNVPWVGEDDKTTPEAKGEVVFHFGLCLDECKLGLLPKNFLSTDVLAGFAEGFLMESDSPERYVVIALIEVSLEPEAKPVPEPATDVMMQLHVMRDVSL
ncbi:hypothetical protein KSP39_PZI023673 [Platanthera zijinensis]|uniref:Uncharacterized protein n=1 Tax=Platanthera zijinensis TaxID=2320716 RepID=A0AAP0AT71_9ASPA